MNLAAMVDEIGRAVTASVSRSLAPISRQVEELMAWRKSVGEIRNGVDGQKGEPGVAGKDGSAGLDGKDGAPGVNGKDGAPGKDGVNGKDGAPGKDAPPVDLDAVVAKVLPMIPLPKDGRDGRDGADGVNGKDGLNGRDGERGEKGADGINGKDGNGIARFDHDPATHTLDIVMDSGEAFTLRMPVPQRGEKGEPGLSGNDGAAGPRGEKGDTPSAEEIEAAVTKACEAALPVLIGKHLDAMMDTIVTRASLMVPPGRDGLPGRPGTTGDNGRDGASIDDISLDKAGPRLHELTIRLSDGRVMKHPIHLDGMVLDADVHRPGEQYAKGDAVTHGGSYWIARTNTAGTPGKSEDWRLAVKRGRDGKDAE